MTELFFVKLFLMAFLLYIIGLFFTFLSEFTYKKRSLLEVREDFGKIIKKFTLIYFVFLISSLIYYFLGIRTE